MSKEYNNFCRKCRNRKHWGDLFVWRVTQMLKEKKGGKTVKARLSKLMEEKLKGKNVSEIIRKALAFEVAKDMDYRDDEIFYEKDERDKLEPT